jgi:hypothetical protein
MEIDVPGGRFWTEKLSVEPLWVSESRTVHSGDTFEVKIVWPATTKILRWVLVEDSPSVAVISDDGQPDAPATGKPHQ